MTSKNQAVNLVNKLFESSNNYDQLEKRIPNAHLRRELIDLFDALKNSNVNYDVVVNSKDIKGNTALVNIVTGSSNYAVEPSLRSSLVKFLLFHGADPNARNDDGETALFKIAAGNDVNNAICLAEILIQNGADVKIRNNKGLTVLHNEIIISSSAKNKELRKIRNNNNNYLKFLLEKFGENSPDVRCSKTNYEKTALMLCAENGNAEFCRHLIANGASTNVRDLQGYTALHYAVMGSRECVEILLKEGGANPYIESSCGRNAFEQAGFAAFDFEVLQLLAEELLRENNEDLKKMAADMYETAGAMALSRGNYDDAYVMWQRARDVTGSGPMNNQEEELFRNKGTNLYLRAFRKIEELSGSNNWNLLRALVNFRSDVVLRVINPDDSMDRTVIDVTNHVIEKIEAENDINKMASLDGEHIAILCRLIEYVDMEQTCFRTARYSNRHLLGLAHFVSKMATVCLRKWIEISGGESAIPYKFHNLFYYLCDQLQRSVLKDDDDSEFKMAAFKITCEIVNLDPRDPEQNTLLHLACERQDAQAADAIDLLLKCGANVNACNVNGYTPIQMVAPSTDYTPKIGAAILKMVEAGAHADSRYRKRNCSIVLKMLVDRKHVNPLPYLGLQCLAARVLARNKDLLLRCQVPKTLLHFINIHC